MRLIPSLLTSVLLTVVAAAEAKELLVEGNEHLSGEAILEAAAGLDCPEDDSLCVQEICRKIAGMYWEAGYLDAKVECDRPRRGCDTVTVTVTEGRVSNLAAVEIVGSEAFAPSDLAHLFDCDMGAPFSSARLERGIGEMLEFFDQRGYPAASVQPEMFRAGKGGLEVTLRVDEGRRAEIGNVIFSGLTRTRRNILLAETGITIGDTYDGRRVDVARARLLALGVFASVSEPVLGFGPGDSLVIVGFDVAERRTNRIEGLAAYAPGRDEGKVIGSLNLELGNIAGTLRRLKVLYDRPGQDRLRWTILYREPRLAGMRVALDAGIFSDVLEDSYARRRFSLGMRFRREVRLELGLGGFLGTTKDRSDAGGEGDFGERGLSFDFIYEARDRPANPRSGQMLSLTHDIATLDFERPRSEDRTLSAVGVRAEYVLQASENNVVGFGSRFMGVFSSTGRIPPSHIIRLGGFTNLRGYPEEWFSVEEALVLTFEARRVLGPDSRLYAFLDAATFEGGGRDFGDLNQLPLGYGIGFVGGSRSGVFRLEIALGRGDTFSEGKLHFGLVKRF